MNRSALIFALLSVLLWSTTAWLGLHLTAVPPFLMMGLALCLGSLCSIHQVRHWRAPFKALLLGVCGLLLSYLCYFLSLRYAPPIEANLINYLWPLFIVLLSPVVLPKYVLKHNHVLAAILGFTGACLIVTGGHLSLDRQYAFGYFLAGLGALIWATYSLLAKRISNFPTPAIGLCCLLSGSLALLIHLSCEPSYALSFKEMLFILLLGLGPMGAVFYLWDSAMKRGDPRIIGALSYLIPLLSTLLLIASGRGRLTVNTGLAILLIIAGAIVGTTGSSHRPKHRQALDKPDA